MIVSLEDSIKI